MHEHAKADVGVNGIARAATSRANRSLRMTSAPKTQDLRLKTYDSRPRPTMNPGTSVRDAYFFKLSGSAAPPIASANRPPSTGRA